MQTFEKPIQFRWILAIAFTLWAVTVGCYLAGLTEPGVFSLFKSLLVPILVIVPLAPLSLTGVVRHRWFEPGFAAWAGLAIPGVHFAGSRLTGIGLHCDRIVMIGGAAAFVAINLLWAIEVFQRRMRRDVEIGIPSPSGTFQSSTASGA